MIRLSSISNFGLLSISSLGLVLALGACGSSTPTPPPGGTAGASPGAGGASGGNPGNPGAGAPGPSAGGGPVPTAGTGSGGAPDGTAGAGVGGANPGGAGAAGNSPAAGAGGAPITVNLPPVITSSCSSGTCSGGAGMTFTTDGTVTDSTAAAIVTVADTVIVPKWDGFGAAFNEIGWNVLTTPDMQNAAIKLLFSATDGANFAWGRIPMGASDYATSRYTPEDNAGADPAPNSSESTRPAKDTGLANFSLSRDMTKLIPFIKAAQAVKSDIHFWASPWTPPIWMKTGYAGKTGTAATKPSYYDGGSMSSDAAILTAYAQYYSKFVTGYKDQGINIELVSPQNEPGYEQNYPSCLWDKATYTSWVGTYLGPAMKTLGVRVMLGTLSNNGDGGRKDTDISSAVLADATAKGMVSVVGVQWGVLDAVVGGTTFSGLPIWATEHRCGNYPWMTDSYNKTQAPNDLAYGVESWGYIRDAITKGKVTSYSAWNMVLDKSGLGNDTTRDWKQDALLVADGGKVTPTAAYYVFRHFSQYVAPNAAVLTATGGDAVAFKNPDGSYVVVMYNSGAANPNYVVAVGGKKVQFAMPAAGWATVKVKP
ncbi:MAG: glycoside hydrolase family 30 beta sandwich domain-containing protein [Pseudomonadota bacterium]